MRADQVIVASYDVEDEEVRAELRGARPMLRASRLRVTYRDIREIRPTPEQLVAKASRAAEEVVAVRAARAAGLDVDPPRGPDDVEEESPRNYVRIRRPR